MVAEGEVWKHTACQIATAVRPINSQTMVKQGVLSRTADYRLAKIACAGHQPCSEVKQLLLLIEIGDKDGLRVNTTNLMGNSCT